MDFAFGILSKNSLTQGQKDFSVIFFSRSFIALAVIFRSMIHFDLNTVYGVR